MDVISQNQISSSKRIGDVNGAPLFELLTKGGLYIIVASQNGKNDLLGAGPHRAIARFIAKKKNAQVRITELSKSDSFLSEIEIQRYLPYYMEITDKLRGE